MISCDSIKLIFLASAIVFGYAYCLDLLQALQVQFRQPPYSFTTMQFNLMYFFTFLPICLFNIPIGTIIDRSQVTVSLLVLLLLSLVSQLVSSLMVQTQVTGYIFIMFAMRSLFGIAGQGIFTVQGIIITKYCKDSFQTVMSVALSLPFLFDAVNSLVTTRVYDVTGSISIPYYIGTGVCMFALFCGLVLIKSYVRRQNKIAINHESLLSAEQNNIQKQEIKNQQEQSSCNIKQLRSFNSIFWILIVSGFFTEGCLGGFNDNLNDLLVKRFNIPYTDAGLLLITPFLFQTVFAIIFSIIMSKWTRTRRPLYVLSTLLYLVGQIHLYFLPNTTEPTVFHYIVVIFFSLTLSFGLSIYYTAIIAAVPYIVNKGSMGTAFGVIGCFVGMSQCITPLMNAGLIDSDSQLSISYKNLNLVYILLAFIAVCFAVYINWGPFQSIDQRFVDLQQDQKENKTIAALPKQ